MFKLSYEEIVKKITEKGDISKKETEEKIERKMNELHGLISREGAAHIISNELGVKLFDFDKKEFKINEIVPGLRNVKLNCKVIQKYEIREFNKENRKGRVATLFIGDETGSSRAVIWDEKLMSDFEKINEGDILTLENCYIRQNNNYKEIHLGNDAKIKINPKDVEIKNIGFTVNFDRKKIKDLISGEFASVFATIVQIFEPRYYLACPECNVKVNLDGEKYKCDKHGIVKEKQVPILNIYLDDGTENIRAVSFGETVYSLLGLNQEEFEKYRNDFENLKSEHLGKQMIFNGKIRKNEMFNRNEMSLSSFEEIDPKEMAQKILE